MPVSTPALKPVIMKRPIKKCTTVIDEWPSKRRRRRPYVLIVQTDMTLDKKLTTPTTYVPYLAVKPPSVSSPRMVSRMVLEYCMMTLMPATSWKTTLVILTQVART